VLCTPRIRGVTKERRSMKVLFTSFFGVACQGERVVTIAVCLMIVKDFSAMNKPQRKNGR
jgi:hypothetical protein